MFSKLGRVIQNSNVVLLSDSVGIYSTNALGFHNTKMMWRWIENNIDGFIDAGIDTLAMEFIRRDPDFKSVGPDKVDHTTIVPSDFSNVNEEDIEVIRSICRKIKIIGIDQDMYEPKDVLNNIYHVQELATPKNRIGIVVGSGYAKEICRDSRFDKFPSTFFEMFNLDRDFYPDEIHLISLFCEDYR